MSVDSGDVSIDDLSNSITSPKGKPKKKIGEAETVKYDSNGRTDSFLKESFSERDVCAVKSKADKNTIYRIQIGRGGHFYNPLKKGLTYGLDVTSKTTNEKMFQLREVNKVAFDNYVKFLETRYDTYLFAAERK